MQLEFKDLVAIQLIPTLYTEYWARVDSKKYAPCPNWQYGIASSAYGIDEAMCKVRESKRESNE